MSSMFKPRTAIALACLGTLIAAAPGALSQPKPPPAPAASVSAKAGVPGAPSVAVSASAAVPSGGCRPSDPRRSAAFGQRRCDDARAPPDRRQGDRAAASRADAPAGRRAPRAREGGGLVRGERQGLPLGDHPHRPASLRGPPSSHPLGARLRDHHREEGPPGRARGGDQTARGVRREIQRRQRAPGEPAGRDVPPRRALRGARPHRHRHDRGSRRRPQARRRPLQAGDQGVPEVPRARGHLLLPRPRLQRLVAHPRGAAGLAQLGLPQPLRVPGPRRSQGSREGLACRSRRTTTRNTGTAGRRAIRRRRAVG